MYVYVCFFIRQPRTRQHLRVAPTPRRKTFATEGACRSERVHACARARLAHTYTYTSTFNRKPRMHAITHIQQEAQDAYTHMRTYI